MTELAKYLKKCSTTDIVINLGSDPEFDVDLDNDDEEDFTEYKAPEGVQVHLCGYVNFKNEYPRHSKDHHSIVAWPMGIRSVEKHMFS